jgi:hypothetical protein
MMSGGCPRFGHLVLSHVINVLATFVNQMERFVLGHSGADVRRCHHEGAGKKAATETAVGNLQGNERAMPDLRVGMQRLSDALYGAANPESVPWCNVAECPPWGEAPSQRLQLQSLAGQRGIARRPYGLVSGQTKEGSKPRPSASRFVRTPAERCVRCSPSRRPSTRLCGPRRRKTAGTSRRGSIPGGS